MRKYFYIFLALIFLSFQSKELKNNIIGEWEVKQIKSDEMQVKPFKNIKDISLSKSYIFTKDGAVTINSNLHPNSNGNYHIKNDSLILNYIWTDDKVSERYKILEYKSGMMVLEQSFKDWGTLKIILDKVQ